jgi:mannose/cellobiose epimerase-like protein (N-acyl-D-glucosamine 2-epimerase family)
MMDPIGRSLEVSADGKVAQRPPQTDPPVNYSELFYAKGLAAAAWVLGDEGRSSQGRERFEAIDREIRRGRFRSDQAPLDPRNRALGDWEGRWGHGPWMIAIGTASRFFQITGQGEYVRTGLSYVEHILERHVDLDGRGGVTRKYDMWEFVDDEGDPWIGDDGVLVSDPGHAVEFVGLSLEFLRLCETCSSLGPQEHRRIDEIRGVLPHVLERNFANGFSPEGLGICKHLDLISRRVLHSDMPWWSLPEAMRAGVEAYQVVPPKRRASFAKIAADCSNTLVRHYVRPECHLMAVQTLDSNGNVSPSVPACPDADPGYHTNLPLIDCLELLANK